MDIYVKLKDNQTTWEKFKDEEYLFDLYGRVTLVYQGDTQEHTTLSVIYKRKGKHPKTFTRTLSINDVDFFKFRNYFKNISEMKPYLGRILSYEEVYKNSSGYIESVTYIHGIITTVSELHHIDQQTEHWVEELRINNIPQKQLSPRWGIDKNNYTSCNYNMDVKIDGEPFGTYEQIKFDYSLFENQIVDCSSDSN